MAAASNAVAIGTARAGLAFIRSGELAVLPWRPSWLETNFGIMHLRGGRQSPAVRTMIECLTLADKESFDLARSIAPAGVAEIPEVYAVTGRRTSPALVGL
jgi:hypothetical protein